MPIPSIASPTYLLIVAYSLLPCRCQQFHFSFDLGQTDRQVLPQTYKEAMEFIEGKRRVEIGAEMRRLYQGEEQSEKPQLTPE